MATHLLLKLQGCVGGRTHKCLENGADAALLNGVRSTLDVQCVDSYWLTLNPLNIITSKHHASHQSISHSFPKLNILDKKKKKKTVQCVIALPTPTTKDFKVIRD